MKNKQQTLTLEDVKRIIDFASTMLSRIDKTEMPHGALAASFLIAGATLFHKTEEVNSEFVGDFAKWAYSEIAHRYEWTAKEKV